MMAYCVHCGVELAPSEKKCPLCNTKVYDPSVPEERAAVTPYPPYEPIAPERISKKSVLIVLTLIFMLPVMLSCICDFSINKRIVWAGYVAGGLLQVYALIFMSILLAGKNLRCAPMWKIGVNTFTLLGYLCYIVWVTDGQWFWRFAVPVVLIGALFIVAAILLRKFGGESLFFLRQATDSFFMLNFLVVFRRLENIFYHLSKSFWIVNQRPTTYPVRPLEMCIIQPRLKNKSQDESRMRYNLEPIRRPLKFYEQPTK